MVVLTVVDERRKAGKMKLLPVSVVGCDVMLVVLVVAVHRLQVAEKAMLQDVV